MLYCRVALQGPAGETLGGWVDDSLVSLGAQVFVEQDTVGRPWLVVEVAPNLMLEAQVSPEHRLAVTGTSKSVFRTAEQIDAPAQAPRKPRKLKARAEAQVEAQAQAN